MAINDRFSRRSLSRMIGVDRRLRTIAIQTLELTPFDLTIPSYGGKRTSEEQLMLFKAGKSKCDGVVKTSKHQEGQALDIVPYIDGRGALWDKELLTELATYVFRIANDNEVKIVWGGHWKWDYAHFELI